MRINTCFEIQKKKKKKIEAVSGRKLDSSKGIYLHACSFLAVGNNKEIVCGKREGGLEKNWLKSKEEIGSGEKVEILLKLNISISLKYWAGRKRMWVKILLSRNVRKFT